MATRAIQPMRKRLRVPGLEVCRASYSPLYMPQFATEAILNDSTHVLYPQTKKRYDERSRDTLWWNVTSNTLAIKRVMRSWANRRLRRAMLEALHSNGMDAEGRVVDKGGKSAKPRLRGTLTMFAQTPVLTARFEEVKTQMNSLVSILLRQGKYGVRVLDGFKKYDAPVKG